MNRAEQYCQTIKRMSQNNGGGSILPDEYQQVEYLEGTGSQFIDTHVFLLDSDIVTVDYQFTNIQQTDNTIFYVDSGAYNDRACGISINVSSYGRVFVFGWDGRTDTPASALVDLNRHTAQIERGIFTIDNNELFIGTGNSGVEYPVLLFGWYRRGQVIVRGKVRIFRCTMSPRQGYYYRDFVPCYRKSDGKTGMYDLISESLFQSQGGEFVLGPNV